MKPDGGAEQFLALQLLLLVVDPGFGETRWQWEHAIHQLPAHQLTGEHWYRSPTRGFIHVDEDLNGEYVRELPVGVDRSTVVDVSPAQHSTVLDTMASLIPDMDTAQRPRLHATLDNLRKLSGRGHSQSHVLNFQHLAMAASMADTQTMQKYFAKSAEFHSGDGLRQGITSAIEAGAILLIQALSNALLVNSQAFTRICGMVSAPGVPSIEEAARRMVVDCIRYGFSSQVVEVLAGLQRQGNGLVEGAREGFYPVGHPETLLHLYYLGLFSAAPYLRAAMVGFEIAALDGSASDKEKRLYATRANAAEEKLARVTDAIMFNVRNQDGSQSRSKRSAVQAAFTAGDKQKAKALAMETVDLKLFLPKPYKEYLLRPSVVAEASSNMESDNPAIM